VTAPGSTPYLGYMVRLLLGLVAVIIGIVLISALIHALFFGFWIVLVAAITFGVFHLSRRSRRRV
jgi:hypothetical protein